MMLNYERNRRGKLGQLFVYMLGLSIVLLVAVNNPFYQWWMLIILWFIQIFFIEMIWRVIVINVRNFKEVRRLWKTLKK